MPPIYLAMPVRSKVSKAKTSLRIFRSADFRKASLSVALKPKYDILFTRPAKRHLCMIGMYDLRRTPPGRLWQLKICAGVEPSVFFRIQAGRGLRSPSRRGANVMADNGLVTVPSRHAVRETIDRLEAELKAREIAVFARIDHAAGAAEAGLMLRPTFLLIFGNPKAGTPLMQARQAIGMDLPLKILVWEDEAGSVWLSYNDPLWIVRRHDLSDEKSVESAKAMQALLADLARNAAGT
jgi:uncharacterized protein (DUF302 family)